MSPKLGDRCAICGAMVLRKSEANIMGGRKAERRGAMAALFRPEGEKRPPIGAEESERASGASLMLAWIL